MNQDAVELSFWQALFPGKLFTSYIFSAPYTIKVSVI
jgi:hypothetical protein